MFSLLHSCFLFFFFFFKQKTAYEMRISDWSSDVCSSDLKLYSRQVFITDEVKDIVPDFLMLLHGVIDSPDIPLNVSRSFLQADSSVRKINSYISKKVADKLDRKSVV